MSPKGYKNISLPIELFKKINRLRGNKSYGGFIKDLIEKSDPLLIENLKHRIKELELENERLKAQTLTTEDLELPCVYASWNNPEQRLVDCAKWLGRKGKIITLRYEACQKCFERRTFIQQRKQEKQDDFSKAYGKGTQLYRASQPLNLKEEIYCPDGLFVTIAKCQRCPPHKKLACKQFKQQE